MTVLLSILRVPADWVDVKDPNVIAETELLQAAASIEAAAKKLAELKPKRTVVCYVSVRWHGLVDALPLMLLWI